MFDHVVNGIVPVVIAIAGVIIFFIALISLGMKTRIVTVLLSAIGFLLLGGAATIDNTRSDEIRETIIANVHDRYGIEVKNPVDDYDHPGLNKVANGITVPVSIHVNGILYEDTYSMVLDDNEDITLLMVKDNHGNAPSPQELEEHARSQNL